MIGTHALEQLRQFVADSPASGGLDVVCNTSATTGLYHVYVMRHGSDTTHRIDPGHQAQNDAVLEGQIVHGLIANMLTDMGNEVRGNTGLAG